ncbi:MAG: hypothetical protein HKN50_03555 [Gammaproteobacteria bacterium]|nr:hypothetical protein [Gammaproteobacteria bacterium]
MSDRSSQIELLQQRYRTSLIEKSVEIAELRIQYESTDDDESAALASQTLGDFLHKLAGSAGMYGYTEIAISARNIMMTLQNDDSGQLSAQLDQLIAMCEQASDGTST